MLIDNKGRLFGKINLLDLVVLLGLLAVAGRFAYGALAGSSAAPTGQDQVIEMTLRFPAVTQWTVDAIQVGDEVYDSKSNTWMGKIVETWTEPAVIVREVPDGIVSYTSSTHFDLYVKVRGPARVSPNGVTMSGIEVKVGRSNQYKSAFWAATGTTVAFDLNPPER
ncbi:MAG: DUF4330 domain-containing protein [Bacillota bacterium]|uniref:DUF4330 domain-containing protein n=1 Tax=Symbiobacterium thermophilum TaxID=2734 RepID=A0A1Y2T5W4_SYMTR|nr:MAG: hypothetical protein A6D92_09845 [Symbiobacterium thermophilum]